MVYLAILGLALLTLYTRRTIMAAIDDLKSDVAALGTSISAELAAIDAALANGTSEADIQAVRTSVQALKASVDAETAKLTGTPPPTV